MAILKEYRCAAHGDFDAYEPVCPHGCDDSMVERVFRTPPSIQTAGYRQVNSTLGALAAEQGLTDLNQRGGDGMRRFDVDAQRRTDSAMEQLSAGHLKAIDQRIKGIRASVEATFSKTARPVAEVVTHTGDSRPHGGAVFQNGGQLNNYFAPFAAPRPKLTHAPHNE